MTLLVSLYKADVWPAPEQIHTSDGRHSLPFHGKGMELLVGQRGERTRRVGVAFASKWALGVLDSGAAGFLDAVDVADVMHDRIISGLSALD